MSDPELDKRLAEYLERKEAEAANGVTLSALDAAVQRIANHQLAHEKDDVDRHAMAMAAITDVRRDVAALDVASRKIVRRLKLVESESGPNVGPRPSSPDDSGSIDIAVMKTKLEEREEKRRELEALKKDSGSRVLAYVAVGVSVASLVSSVILQLVLRK